MKNMLLLFCIASIGLLSCKDNDKLPDKVNMFLSCGKIPNVDSTHFKLYLPNVYTPDGDLINDEYRFPCVDSSDNVLSITNFVAIDYKNDTVYTADTMVNTMMGLSNVWDFNYSTGNPVYGSLELNFTVTDMDSMEHLVSYDICSFTCSLLKQNGIELDHDKIRYESELNCATRTFESSAQTREPCW